MTVATESMSTMINDMNEEPLGKKNHLTHTLLFRTMIFFQIITYGSYSILVQLCERNGQLMFSSTMMNFILELTKLIFSLLIHLSKCKDTLSIKQSSPYFILGLLYFINNNLAVHIQLYMDPTSYQIDRKSVV